MFQPAGVVPGPHLGHEDVHRAIPVHVGEVHRHGRVGRGPKGEGRGRPERPVSKPEPELIRVVEVVADVEVHVPVPVHVVEPGGQTEIVQIFLQGTPDPIQEGAAGPRDRFEPAGAVVEVESIHVGLLHHHLPPVPHFHSVVVTEFRGHHQRVGLPPGDVRQGPLQHSQHVAGAFRLVRRDVEIQVPVAVHVGQGGGAAPQTRGEAGVRQLREASRPVVEEDGVRTTEGRGHQVRIPVPVQIRHCGAR